MVAALVTVLSTTGLVLNHGDRLDLDHTNIQAAWLVDWYGLSPIEAPAHFRAGDVWVSWIDGAVYARGRRVGEAQGKPRGALELDSLYAVATSEAVVVFTGEGDLVERLGAAFLPGVIERVGTASQDRIVIGTVEGLFASDSDLLTWDPLEGEEVTWSQASSPTDDVLEEQLAAYRGEGLPLSRVLLDLHTGRLFGAAGAALMDAAAILLLVLVATGVVNWIGFRKPRR